jgi:hypothetical protein
VKLQKPKQQEEEPVAEAKAPKAVKVKADKDEKPVAKAEEKSDESVPEEK